MDKVHKELKVESKELKVLQGHKEVKGHKVPKGQIQGLKVRQGLKEVKGHKELKE